MRKMALLLGLMGLLAFGGCRAMGLFHKEVADPPAPTAIPLPLATSHPTSEATAIQPTYTPAPTSTPTAAPTPQPTARPPTDTRAPVPTTPAPEAPPTRMVPPGDTINLPPGFDISVFAAGLSDPRMMTLGPDDQVYLAERGAGRIVRLPDEDRDGVADGVQVVADGLNQPSSIDFYRDGSLIVGETTRILRLEDLDSDGTFEEQEALITGLPSGGHNTRTVLFSPDWAHLFVSVGSSCNVCIENDERRATIMRYQPDGSDGQVYAKGLRNAVGIVFRPGTDELWATNNGRDWLGDNQPPETVYVVDEGDDAGWPRCHSGRIVDPDYGQTNACEGVDDPAIEMQAHSAPLGLTFYTGQQFPEEYAGDLFIAFHGSWNRTVPTGYKVVRVPMQDGQPGPVEEFAAGWLRADGSRWGRPVDVLTGPDGSLLISDDSGGAIYRVFYAGE